MTGENRCRLVPEDLSEYRHAGRLVSERIGEEHQPGRRSQNVSCPPQQKTENHYPTKYIVKFNTSGLCSSSSPTEMQSQISEAYLALVCYELVRAKNNVFIGLPERWSLVKISGPLRHQAPARS